MQNPLQTPYYLIDESRMLKAMQRIRYVQEKSHAKPVLALKCFSTWCVFDFMRQYLSGTTSSSLYEARLGYEKFGGENHAYSVAYNENEIKEIIHYSNKVIFNSLSQLHRFSHYAKGKSIGLRLNPEIGYSQHKLSDTVCQYSRLGVKADHLPSDISNHINGAMLHMNCDNDNLDAFIEQLDTIETRFSALLPKLDWLSLGGGIAFTDENYPLDRFCNRLKALSLQYQLQLYLEPGEASVTNSTDLVVSVLDIVDNEIPTVIVDAGVETHMLDVLIYNYTPALRGARVINNLTTSANHSTSEYIYRVAGRTCLSGDIFGTYAFKKALKIGDVLKFSDAGGYSMVKKNFFNGIAMPSICLKNIQGEIQVVKTFNYEDFRDFLS